ncbi:MAG: hypothetical protein Q7S19_02965 [bacterium]|nr:hypothetical protein [bacterium]
MFNQVTGQVRSWQMQCPLFRCGKFNDVSQRKFEGKILDYCEHCNCPTWPEELGFTGNDPEEVKEFADKHNHDGTPK